MSPFSLRGLRDYNYIANVAGPNQSATTCTAPIDLIQPQWQSGQNTPVIYNPETGQPQNNAAGGLGGPDPMPERFWVNVALTTQSTANTANSKNVTITIQHTGVLSNGTADTGNWATVPTLASPMLTVADNGGTGWATTATVFGTNVGNVATFRLPPGVGRFIRATAALEANGGNACSATVSLFLTF